MFFPLLKALQWILISLRFTRHPLIWLFPPLYPHQGAAIDTLMSHLCDTLTFM